MINRRMIYYVPGWASLSLLLVLCIAFMHQHGVFENVAVIKIYSCRAKDLGNGVMVNLPKRHFSNLFAIGENVAPELAVLKSDIQKMIATNDTIGGIKIHFSAAAKYQSLISILDILLSEKVGWWLIEGNIWVWYNPPPPPTLWIKPIYLCGTADMWKQQVAERLKNEQIAQEAQEMKHISYTLWASWLLFVALAVSPITASSSRHKK